MPIDCPITYIPITPRSFLSLRIPGKDVLVASLLYGLLVLFLAFSLSRWDAQLYSVPQMSKRTMPVLVGSSTIIQNSMQSVYSTIHDTDDIDAIRAKSLKKQYNRYYYK